MSLTSLKPVFNVARNCSAAFRLRHQNQIRKGQSTCSMNMSDYTLWCAQAEQWPKWTDENYRIFLIGFRLTDQNKTFMNP